MPITLETATRYDAGAKSSPTWAGCDDAGALAGSNPQGITMARVGQAANHLAGAPRVLFCQHLKDVNSPTTTTDPLFRLFFSERMPQHTTREWVALALPRAFPTPPVSVADFGRSPGGPVAAGTGYDAGTIASPDDLVEVAVSEDHIVGNRWREVDAMVRNGFRLVGLTVYERTAAGGGLDASRDVYRPTAIGPGGPIKELQLHAIRRMLQNSWRWGRATYCGSVVGDATSARITGTTATNIIDQTSTSRTASTPGILVDALYGAQALDTEADAFVAVHASITGGADGQVQFISSQNTVTITGITTTSRWYRASMSTPLQLDATTGTRGDNAASDKVDILAAAGTGGQSIDVHAWAIIPCGRLL